MPHFASLRPRLRGVALTIAIVASALFAMAGSTARADSTSAVAPVSLPVVQAPAARPTVQLADEIVRRLRRLGINFSKSRLDRPYDGDGEVC